MKKRRKAIQLQIRDRIENHRVLADEIKQVLSKPWEYPRSKQSYEDLGRVYDRRLAMVLKVANKRVSRGDAVMAKILKRIGA